MRGLNLNLSLENTGCNAAMHGSFHRENSWFVISALILLSPLLPYPLDRAAALRIGNIITGIGHILNSDSVVLVNRSLSPLHIADFFASERYRNGPAPDYPGRDYIRMAAPPFSMPRAKSK